MIKEKYIYLFLFISFKLLAQEYLPKSEGEIIRHKHYTLSYNEDHEQANWVHYRLNPTFLNGITPRINSFKVDPNVSTKSADLSDYKGSGYDRGHLAPAGDMKYSRESMKLAFLLNEADFNPTELNTNATLTFTDSSVTSIELILKGKVPSLNEKKFVELAEDAKNNCPISAVLNCEIILNASLI